MACGPGSINVPDSAGDLHGGFSNLGGLSGRPYSKDWGPN